MSKFTFNSNSREVQEMGLQDLPNLDMIVVGVGYDRDDEGSLGSPGIGYHLYSHAYVRHTDDETPEWDEDREAEYSGAPDDPSGSKYEAWVTLKWMVDDLEEEGANRSVESWDTASWNTLLGLLQRQAKVQFNMFGEGRSSGESEATNARLAPAFPKLPGMTVPMKS